LFFLIKKIIKNLNTTTHCSILSKIKSKLNERKKFYLNLILIKFCNGVLLSGHQNYLNGYQILIKIIRKWAPKLLNWIPNLNGYQIN